MVEPKRGDGDSRALTLIDCDADHAKGSAFNMLFMVWRHRTDVRAYRRGIVCALELGRRYPEGIGICQLVDADAVAPDADARAAFVDLYRLGVVKHLSVTYEGTGFKAAAVRAVIAGAQALGRPKYPHSVHFTLAAAARWHAKHQAALGRPETAALIERSIQDLRRIQRETFPQLPKEEPPAR
jgi:hypothetical protein